MLLYYFFYYASSVNDVNSPNSVVINNTADEGIKGSLGNDTINLIEGVYKGVNKTNISILSGKT